MYPDPETFVNGVIEVLGSGIWPPSSIFPVNEMLPRVIGGGGMSRACGAPYGNTPVVDVNGDVYACIYWVGIPEFLIGNVIDGTYPDRQAVNRMLNELHVDNISECKVCNWRFICGGGCPVKRMTVDKNPKSTPEVIEYSGKITCLTSKKLCETLFWRVARENYQKAIPANPLGQGRAPIC